MFAFIKVMQKAQFFFHSPCVRFPNICVGFNNDALLPELVYTDDLVLISRVDIWLHCLVEVLKCYQNMPVWTVDRLHYYV